MKGRLVKAHRWLETLPERLYPFWQEVGGLPVRGKQAYDRTLQKAKELYGPQAHGYRLLLYRGVWHMLGSLVLISICTVTAAYVFNSHTALIVFLTTSVIAICLQELILHPRRYGQTMYKSLFDIATWVMPIVVYARWFVV